VAWQHGYAAAGQARAFTQTSKLVAYTSVNALFRSGFIQNFQNFQIFVSVNVNRFWEFWAKSSPNLKTLHFDSPASNFYVPGAGVTIPETLRCAAKRHNYHPLGARG
jgi:hypothetical protein